MFSALPEVEASISRPTWLHCTTSPAESDGEDGNEEHEPAQEPDPVEN